MRVRAFFAAVLCASVASAHTLGISESELTVQADGVVQARLAIPTLELSALAPIDRDGDGRITQAEVDQQRAHFERLVPGLLELRADGKECTVRLERIVVGPEHDGADLFSSYRCTPQPTKVEVQALVLAALPLSHRHTLVLRAGEHVERAALGGPLRRAEIVTHFEAGWDARRIGAWVLLAALASAMILFALRRRSTV